MRAFLFCFAAVVTGSSCATVKSSMTRGDWAQEDQAKVKRLAVLASPAPNGDVKAAELVARIARRYVNQKRDFLVKRELTEQTALEAACGGEDAIEGVLHLELGLVAKGAGYETTLHGRLQRCGDGREAWSVHAGGSFNSKDELLTEVTQVYVRELGPQVEPYVAPVMNVLRPALDTLPQPKLTEDDVTEKLSLD